MPKLVRKAESCEICGRDLPDSEWCKHCNHDNHQVVLGGWACKRIRNEIAEDRAVKGLWKTENKDGKNGTR